MKKSNWQLISIVQPYTKSKGGAIGYKIFCHHNDDSRQFNAHALRNLNHPIANFYLYNKLPVRRTDCPKTTKLGRGPQARDQPKRQQNPRWGQTITKISRKSNPLTKSDGFKWLDHFSFLISYKYSINRLLISYNLKFKSHPQIIRFKVATKGLGAQDGPFAMHFKIRQSKVLYI